LAAAGWLFGAGQLAMTADDLARWDISLMKCSLLSKASCRARETDTLLTNGVGAQYGLGVGVELENQRRKISHGGEVNGFTAENAVYPDERAAIVILVNQDASRATVRLQAADE
jgi:D-alanyl-D-alanine carboxypeptidase